MANDHAEKDGAVGSSPVLDACRVCLDALNKGIDRGQGVPFETRSLRPGAELLMRVTGSYFRFIVHNRPRFHGFGQPGQDGVCTVEPLVERVLAAGRYGEVAVPDQPRCAVYGPCQKQVRFLFGDPTADPLDAFFGRDHSVERDDQQPPLDAAGDGGDAGPRSECRCMAI